MLTDLAFVAAGMIVGWFFLPRPQWAVNLMAALAVKFPALAPYVNSKPPTP